MHRDWRIVEENGPLVKIENQRYGFQIVCSSTLAWAYFLEDYEAIYHFLNYQGKTVLDVGAGVGETALLFLAWGARKVYAYENDEQASKYLLLNAKDKPIEAYPLSVCKMNIDSVLSHPIDIAKFDCEGCEEALLTANLKLINKIPIWMVEAHSRELEFKLIRRFIFLGFKTQFLFRLTPEVCMFYASKLNTAGTYK